MKKLTTTMVLGLFLAINAKANHYNVQLNLKLYDNAPFTLSIDNVKYTNPSCAFSTSNITPGNHYITVTKHIINPYGYYGNSSITVFKLHMSSIFRLSEYTQGTMIYTGFSRHLLIRPEFDRSKIQFCANDILSIFFIL